MAVQKLIQYITFFYYPMSLKSYYFSIPGLPSYCSCPRFVRPSIHEADPCMYVLCTCNEGTI